MSPLSWLKPDMGKKAKHKTQIKKKTLNPEFNEVRLPHFVVYGIVPMCEKGTGSLLGCCQAHQKDKKQQQQKPLSLIDQLGLPKG